MKILAADTDWVAIDADAEASDLAAIAAAVVCEAEALRAVGTHDPEVYGVRLFGLSPAAHARLVAALMADPVGGMFRAIVRPPPWRDGRLEETYAGEAAVSEFSVHETRGDACELAIRSRSANARAVRFHLARAGLPVAGDPRRGGAVVAGALRLRSASLQISAAGIDVVAPEPDDFWPNESLVIPEQPRPTLTVSNATAAALRRGHPWVIADDDTSDVEALPVGALVEVRSTRGDRAGLARIEGHGRVAARRWSRSGKRGAVESVESRVARAIRKRAKLRADPTLDAYRLIHGEADGLPGLAVDRLGPMLRVLMSGRACESVLDRVLHALPHHLAGEVGPEPPIVRVVHLAEPPSGRLRGVELIRGSLEGLLDPDGRVEIRERDLRFSIDPGLSDPYRPRPGTGFFLDQRDNRERVTHAAGGGRWLNLFSHTGAFSAAALAGGAREVVSVDLSAPYLAWLEANLARNGLAGSKHSSVRGDARRYLERLAANERFDGIVLDPPTAARAGRRFWSLRQDGGALLGACLGRLAPGGRLLACRNDHQTRGTLARLLEEVAHEHGVALDSVDAAPPAADFPDLAGFPEGRAFEAAFAVVR